MKELVSVCDLAGIGSRLVTVNEAADNVAFENVGGDDCM